ncbi:MAG: DUF4870 domain-containing protein [Burkholderiales bacterium]|nr:DUF4870 domain-containing protein [Anaerolineae bacterium]
MAEDNVRNQDSGDEERVSRLSRLTPPENETAAQNGAARIKSNIGIPTSDVVIDDDDDSVVREYEERYYGGGKAKTGAAPATFAEKLKTRSVPRSYSTMNLTDDERLWATVAHGSIWITMLVGLFTAGFAVPVTIFIPLVIYFLFRKRSNFIAFHALQAFVVQLLGTVGALALLMVGGAIWGVGMLLAMLLMFVLVGFVLVPVWGVVGIILLAAVVALPLLALLYGTIGAVHTNKGSDYRYPFVARWVDRQMSGGLLN